ncbi:MAG: hypothetical protein AAB389_04600 [Patescibacteria group bacterium]
MSGGVTKMETRTPAVNRLILLWQSLQGMINNELARLPEWEVVSRVHGYTYDTVRLRGETLIGQGPTPTLVVRFKLVRSADNVATPVMPRPIKLYFGSHGPVYKFGEHAFAPEMVARLAAIYIANGLNGTD